MEKMKRRFIAILLTLVMVLSPMAGSFKVLAAETPTEVLASGSGWMMSLFKVAVKACATKVVSWGKDDFMAAVFGAKTNEEQEMLKDVQSQLSTVLGNQQKIMDELNHLGSLVEIQSYMNIINQYTAAINQCQSFFTCYDTLAKLDKKYAGNPEILKTERVKALTNGLGIGDAQMTSTDTNADKNFRLLYNAFVGPHQYTVNSETKTGDLFDIYREIKRYEYCWENEAWDEMEAFFEYATACYALVSSIEIGSVQARIQLCDEHNQGKSETAPDYWSTASLETWLYTEGGIAPNLDLKKRIEAGQAVFQKHPVTRQDVYRHYWKPGHEMLFYAHIDSLRYPPVNEPMVGQGGKSAGEDFKNAKGLLPTREGQKAKINDKFWNEGFYDSDRYPDADLITTDDINNLLEGCNHKKTLDEILAAGNFETLRYNYTGLVLKKDDSKNPFIVDETHNVIWMEGYGDKYIDEIIPYVRYVLPKQKDALAQDSALKYGTYRYYHNGDTYPSVWYITNNYTNERLAQLFVCKSTCTHDHLKVDEASAVVPTCTSTGKEADLLCPDCGYRIPGEILPIKHQSEDSGWAYDSSCHFKFCELCGEKCEIHAHDVGSYFITGILHCYVCGYSNMFGESLKGFNEDCIVSLFAIETEDSVKESEITSKPIDNIPREIKAKLGNSWKVLAAQDINVKPVDGDTFKGKFLICFSDDDFAQYKNSEVMVFHLKDDGTVEELKADWDEENQCFTVITESFSPFVLAVNTASIAPRTGIETNNTANMIAIVTLTIAAVGCLCWLSLKKKNNK